MCLKGHKRLKYIGWREWNQFIPYLHRLFLSFKEYNQIIRNLAYIREDIQRQVKETPFMKAYVIANLWGTGVSFSEMWDMDYKNFFKLYLYSIGDKLMVKKSKSRDYHQ